MNNYRITSLSPPTDNNDAANKQFIINSSSNIYLYGSVDNRGIVNFNNFDLRIGNIHIISFGVLTNNSYNRIGDSVSFNLRGSFSRPMFNSTHPNGNQRVNISVDRKYNGGMSNFTLRTGRNLPFYIIYKSLNI